MDSSTTTISERERRCLDELVEYFESDMNCLYFKYIASETKLTESQVRRAVRSLARKGLAEYVRGLFDDDGQVAGSGYCATFQGALLVKGCVKCKQRVRDMDDGTCEQCWQDRPCGKCGKRYQDHKLVNGYMQEFEDHQNPQSIPLAL
jgi:hypothetical protein